MCIEQTLLIIKPNSVMNNVIGEIYNRFEKSRFKIIAIKMLRLNKCNAKSFYIDHKKKYFFNNLINFISSGPIVVSVLKCYNAINRARELIGCANPSLSLTGTIRFDYANNITENSVHASDSQISAIREINFFFSQEEIF